MVADHIANREGPIAILNQAHKFTSSVTGASGTHCCLVCRNIKNMEPEKLAGHAYFKHYALAYPYEFHRHDAESFWKLVDEVHAKAAGLAKTPRKQLQSDSGIVWNPHGILVDEYLRNVFCPATHTYFDPMHCLCASSGVSQYHLNGFANDYVVAGGRLQDLDLFQRSIIWPPGKNRALRRRYFEKQVVQKPAEHIKSFASDVLSGVLTCLWFCKLILLPKDVMIEHCSALEMLQMVHDILFYMGDKAAELVDLLESVLVIHHNMFLKLYGARAAKIKFHLLYHVVDALRRWKRSLNCFPTERMHAGPKKLAQHHPKIGAGNLRTDYTLRRCVAEMLDMDDSACSEYFLVAPKPYPSWRRVLSPLVKGINPMVYALTEISCSFLGRLRSNTLVLFASPSGQTSMGQLQFFCHCTSMDSPEDFFFALYIRYVQVSDLEWAPCSEPTLVKPCQEIRWPLPYLRSSGNRVIPFLPHDELRAAW